MTTITTRPVFADEWARARDLRLEALRDPDAPMAFLATYAQEAAQPDMFWRDRAAAAARGDHVTQIVAAVDDDWAGSVTVLVQDRDAPDHHAPVASERRGKVVAVYVRPSYRSSGAIDRLLDAAVVWAADRGLDRLTLDVHRENMRARRANRRCGFALTGRTFTGPIGPEVEMARPVRSAP